MPHPLETRIAQIRRKAQWLLVLHGLSWVLAAAVAAVVVLTAADYLLHFQDRGIRVLSTLAVLAVLGWTIWRRLLPAITSRFSDVNIAMRIERRFPGLNDRLASTVQFLGEGEQSDDGGSAALRRAVVIQTTAEVEQLNLGDAIDSRAPRQALLVALVVAGVALGLVVVDPSSARLALTRLANPWGDQGWPQRTHLALKQPVERLALGETFEIVVVDSQGAALPDEVNLHIRYTGDAGDQADEVVPMRFVDGVMLYRKEGVRRPFSYRAVGGDDHSMTPVQLIVVEPPTIETLSVALYYPAYTGWRAESAEKNIRALRGTRVELTGTTTKPLGSARVELDGGRLIDCAVAEDGFGFHLPVTGDMNDFVIEDSGTYHVLLEDRDEGVVGGREIGYDIRAIPDLPPSVSIDEPTGNIFVTADAEVPLKVTAKEDLALREIALVYLRSDHSDEGHESFPLYQGPEGVAPGAGPRGAETGESRTVEHRWALAELALQPGMQITFHATAGDYLPQSGQSQPRRLTVITRDELETRVAERQSFILGELTRVLQMQRDARAQVADLEIQMRDVGQMTKGNLDQLQGAELAQRNIDRNLTSPAEGIPSQVEGLLADLENNKVDSPDIERRMLALLGELKRLEQDHLPPIGKALTGAIKGAQDQRQSTGAESAPADESDAGSSESVGKQQPDGDAPSDEGQPRTNSDTNGADTPSAEVADDGSEVDAPDDAETNDAETNDAAPDAVAGEPGETSPPRPLHPAAKAVAADLNTAGENQDEVIGTLERMLGELSQGENLGRVFREIGQIRKEQGEVADATGQIGRETLTKEFADLTGQQQADLKKLAGRQQEMARRFDKVQDRMRQLGQSLAQDDPLAADALSDALEQARQQALAGQMREAGRKVEQNQLGQAGGQQSKIGEQLQEMLDTLANRREQELSRLVEKLREAEEQLAQLRDQQEGLRKRMQEAANNPDEAERRRELERLSREQKELREQVERFARKLERLQASQAAQTASNAGGKMGQAGEQGEQGDAGGAQDAAQGAQKDLEEAQQQLAERRRQAEIDLAMEQLAKIEDALRGLHSRQERALDDTRRLDQLQTEQGKLTRAQSISVQDLARVELSLSAEAEAQAKKLAAAQVFSLALRGVARELTRAGELLGQRQLGRDALSAEETALRRLAQLLESLKPDDTPPGDQQEGQEGQEGDGGGQQGQPGDGIPNIAQLKLLKLLQSEINGRTRALAEAHGPDTPLTDEQLREYAGLSQEQGELAEIIINLSQPAEDDLEADLDALPDLMPEEDDDEPLGLDETLPLLDEVLE
jgi:hypothetical protein